MPHERFATACVMRVITTEIDIVAML